VPRVKRGNKRRLKRKKVLKRAKGYFLSKHSNYRVAKQQVEHSLVYERPQRVWTTGPMFRHERPQRGRYRQFHQINAEALGFAGPDVDRRRIECRGRIRKSCVRRLESHDDKGTRSSIFQIPASAL
jgi:hypothetical protein